MVRGLERFREHFQGHAEIIPLKARAWLDLTDRKEQGEAVDTKDIKKHKNDIFRLHRIISPDIRVAMPEHEWICC